MEIYSFWVFPGSVTNYKLLRVSYKSMGSMEIIFHSAAYNYVNPTAAESNLVPFA